MQWGQSTRATKSQCEFNKVDEDNTFVKYDVSGISDSWSSGSTKSTRSTIWNANEVGKFDQLDKVNEVGEVNELDKINKLDNVDKYDEVDEANRIAVFKTGNEVGECNQSIDFNEG